MPELDKKETLDPLVLAALIEDPEEDDEDKKLREKYFGDDAGTSDDDEEEDNDTAGASDDDEEEEDNDKPDPKKPSEAADDPDNEEDNEEENDDKDKPEVVVENSKQPSEAQQKAFIESIKKDGYKKPSIAAYNYNPIDYSATEELKVGDLQADRDKYGASKMAEGAQIAAHYAEQDKFFTDLSVESRILTTDAKYKFLDDTDKKNFDAEKAADLNERYLALVGFKQQYQTDAQGNVLYDPKTRQPVVLSSVEHPELSYEKFVKAEVARMERWANKSTEDAVESTTKNLTSMKKKQGIRPGGGGRKTIGALNLGDISKMSDEDFDKHEAEIDKQILNML